MDMFLTENKNIINNECSDTHLFSYQRGAKEISTPQNGNTTPKLVISFTILRNYLAILGRPPVNLGVYITRSAISVVQGPNESSIAGYGHTPFKIIISLPICRGEFLYLLPCSIVLSDENIYRPTVSAYVIIDSLCYSRASVHTAVCLPYVRGLEPVCVRRYACHTYVD